MNILLFIFLGLLGWLLLGYVGMLANTLAGLIFCPSSGHIDESETAAWMYYGVLAFIFGFATLGVVLLIATYEGLAPVKRLTAFHNWLFGRK